MIEPTVRRKPESDPLRGVLSVLCTPFRTNGQVDEESLRRHVKHSLAWGADGLVCFGLAGETYKLTDAERASILAVVIDEADGAVPVVAGTEHTGTEGAKVRSRHAAELGAAAIMVYPPSFVKPDSTAIVDFFATLVESVDIPIVIQDAPGWTGVMLPVDLLAEIADAAPNVRYVKVEAPPTAPKLAAVAAMGLRPISGYGALHLGEELISGIHAIMPGSGLPGLFVDIWQAYSRGDIGNALGLYHSALPLLVFEMGSLDVFVAVQKRLLGSRGVIASDGLRQPGRQLDGGQQAYMHSVVNQSRLRRYLGWPPQVSTE